MKIIKKPPFIDCISSDASMFPRTYPVRSSYLQGYLSDSVGYIRYHTSDENKLCFYTLNVVLNLLRCRNCEVKKLRGVLIDAHSSCLSGEVEHIALLRSDVITIYHHPFFPTSTWISGIVINRMDVPDGSCINTKELNPTLFIIYIKCVEPHLFLCTIDVNCTFINW